MLEKTTKIYIPSKLFSEEYNKSLELGKPTDKLIILFSKIAKGFSTTFEYKNKCDLNACINYAVAEAWQKWDKFNPEVSENLFSFFTTMISNDLKFHYNQITKGKKVNISIDALFSNEKN
jgi:hypothetical protein